MKDKIKLEIKKLLKEKNLIINSQVKDEINEYKGKFCDLLKENYLCAQKDELPLCQDTGMIEFFVGIGIDVKLDFNMEKLLNECVKEIYEENNFRYSIVEDPLFERKNTFNNTPCIVHSYFIDEKAIKIDFLIKGGGSENVTKLFMMKPSATKEEIKNTIVNYVKDAAFRSCPPVIIGIGIGGSSDKALLLSKKALLKDFNEYNENLNYKNFEKELEKEINKLNIGFQGLNEGKTTFSVKMNYYPTHIATLPLAISIDCYLNRKGGIEINL